MQPVRVMAAASILATLTALPQSVFRRRGDGRCKTYRFWAFNSAVLQANEASGELGKEHHNRLVPGEGTHTSWAGLTWLYTPCVLIIEQRSLRISAHAYTGTHARMQKNSSCFEPSARNPPMYGLAHATKKLPAEACSQTESKPPWSSSSEVPSLVRPSHRPHSWDKRSSNCAARKQSFG